MAARMILGVKTAIRALRSVEGMDKLGPAYLMARESAAERVNTLRMGLMLVFMDVVVGWAIGFSEYYCKYVLRPGGRSAIF
jgi:hypothetical protein